MERLLFFASGLILSFPLITACSRNGRAPSSVSSISIPASKLAKLREAIPAGRTPCFGVNVTGSNIPSVTGSSCSPATGILGGYVPAGQDVSVTVASGQTINIDLYLYLLPEGSTAACPVMTPDFPASQLPDTYIVGTASNINVNSAVVSVDMTVNFPASNQNVTQQIASIPAACKVASSVTLPPSPIVPSSGAAVLSGSNLMLRARIGTAITRQTISGSNVNVIVR